MNRFAPRVSGGKFDDAIEWLTWLEKALTAWSSGQHIAGAVHRLAEFRRHEHSLTHAANTWNWNEARREDKLRTLKWIPAAEAYFDFVQAIERQREISADDWTEHVQNVRACIQTLKQNNPPADDLIKY